jgi:hypothetical protein
MWPNQSTIFDSCSLHYLQLRWFRYHRVDDSAFGADVGWVMSAIALSAWKLF